MRLVNWVFGQLLVNFSQLAFKKLNVFKENEVDHIVNFSQLTVKLTYPPCGGSQLVNSLGHNSLEVMDDGQLTY